MRKKGLVLLLSVVFLLVGSLAVFALCPHGCRICGISYDCGASDGVCPEDYGANCRDSSCFYPDPDCGCSCTWVDGSCGGGSCSADQRYQTKSCTPVGCDSGSRCIADSSCSCNCLWVPGACGDGDCLDGQRYHTRQCPPGCAVETTCVADNSCCSCTEWSLPVCDFGVHCKQYHDIYQTRDCSTSGCAQASCTNSEDELIYIDGVDDGKRCRNGLDDDCDHYCDFDNQDPNCPHGDDGCPVRISDIAVNNTIPCSGSVVRVRCSVLFEGVNSVNASLNAAHCPFVGWDGKAAMFNCMVSGSGTQQALCFVDTSRSYQAGVNRSAELTVGSCPACSSPEVCTDDVDNDCDSMIDGNDGDDCPEGSGKSALSLYRACILPSGVQEGLDNDDDSLMDFDDDGCCDLCTGNPEGIIHRFDSSKSPVSAVSGVGCGSVLFTAPGDRGWESGTTHYCCGDDASEFFKSNSLVPEVHACCNSDSHCVDANGICQPGVEEVNELCTNGEDDDCDGLIDNGDTNCFGVLHGYVYDNQGRPVRDAIVKSSPPGVPFEPSDFTDYWGYYEIPDAFVGYNSVLASKVGYDDNITRITVLSGIRTQLNFTLNNGSCHADCTDSYGYCNPACDGLSFTVYNETSKEYELDYCNMVDGGLCDYKPRGYRASFVDVGVVPNVVHEFLCCEGEDMGSAPGARNYTAIKPIITGTAEELYDYVSIVKLFNRTAKMHLLIYR